MKPIATHARVQVDLDAPGGVPLSKDRIALYNSGLVPGWRYERDKDLIAASGAESMRVDLGWGASWMPWTSEVVTTDAVGLPTYDFAETDAIARVLDSCGVRSYWSYSYVPAATRPGSDDWREMGRDVSAWVDTVRAYVAGASERGVRLGYHEVYNEPDLRDERTAEAVFFRGDLEDYLDLYRRTATAIRAADPYARIGGPALAVASVNAHWLRALLQMVTTEDVPLDFLSFHHYGTFSVRSTLEAVIEIVAEFPQIEPLELHLNEYNAFQIDYPRGGLQDTYVLASAFAADIGWILGTRALTRVHWAQYLDSGDGNFSGMVDIDGAPKPVHRVYDFYQHMPIDRCAVVVDGPTGVGALASTDGDHHAILVWNRHVDDIELHLTGLRGEVELQVVDGAGDTSSSLVDATDAIDVRLARGAVAMLRTPGERLPWVDRIVDRVLVHGSASGGAWVDVDERTATVRFGVGSDPCVPLAVSLDVPAGLRLAPRGEVRSVTGATSGGTFGVHLSTGIGEPGRVLLPAGEGIRLSALVAPTPIAPLHERITVVLSDAPAHSSATLHLLDLEAGIA